MFKKSYLIYAFILIQKRLYVIKIDVVINFIKIKRLLENVLSNNFQLKKNLLSL